MVPHRRQPQVQLQPPAAQRREEWWAASLRGEGGLAPQPSSASAGCGNRALCCQKPLNSASHPTAVLAFLPRPPQCSHCVSLPGGAGVEGSWQQPGRGESQEEPRGCVSQSAVALWASLRPQRAGLVVELRKLCLNW